MPTDSPEAERRLNDEPIIWLTTVRPNGQPQASPVWFLRRDDELLVYSLPHTARVGNIEANPRVALNLDGNGLGGAIVTLEGRARIDTSAPPADKVPEYVAKYRDFMARNGWTPEVFASKYSTPIRITISRRRAW
ncbi:MAG: TIGR03667 family PPOX class F420-dependent oxidoreductase [Acidimicrobiia bacterium]|nr:TIGR03667 family PPOX class F420-dependent oxidoreductase [Acidimicrobiia bacterium]